MMSSLDHPSNYASSRPPRSEGDDQERPERSRNAKAQARHRAKRKAYIEQLETTVTKLQTSFGCTPEQLSMMPPPLARIRELETDNLRLQRENDEMRRMLASTEASRSHASADYTRRPSAPTLYDDRDDRDFKKRRGGPGEDLYMSPAPSYTHSETVNRPPPLMIPQASTSQQYGSIGLQNPGHTSNGLYTMNGASFHMPTTPSNSSSTSSPPFSPISLSNGQSQSHSLSPIQHRAPVGNNGSTSMSSHYAQQSGHYGSVKVEDDAYALHSPISQSSHYGQQSTHPQYVSHTSHYGHDHTGWHYATDRAHMER